MDIEIAEDAKHSGPEDTVKSRTSISQFIFLVHCLPPTAQNNPHRAERTKRPKKGQNNKPPEIKEKEREKESIRDKKNLQKHHIPTKRIQRLHPRQHIHERRERAKRAHHLRIGPFAVDVLARLARGVEIDAVEAAHRESEHELEEAEGGIEDEEG